MKSSVTAKLFIAIFATSLLTAVAMGVASRISFTEGFLGYLNEQGRTRMTALIPDLAEAYREHGSWEFLRDNSRLWYQLIRAPRIDADALKPGDQPGPRPEFEMTGLNVRVAVLDLARQPVVGNPQFNQNAEIQPIKLDGVTIGWLSMVPFEEVTTAAALRFQRQQLRAHWIIGGLAALLAAMVAYLLAKIFLAPVRRIASATRRLAAGHYAARVRVSSSDEIGRLAGDFNQLAVTLEKNEQMRRVFMADVSHELRTPIAVLRGELEALEDGVRPLSLDSIRSLQAETRLLGKLVSDLYDLSLSDAGALTYRKADLDVAELLHASLNNARDRFRSRGVALHESPSSAELMVFADEGRLRQLFGNLLENSLRYTDADGQLRVDIRQEAGQVRIDFSDSAPGVPDDLLPRLFERFYRVEASRNRAEGGAGLGLAICRNIAEAHGGTLSASHSTLGGLQMTLTLPLARRAR